METITLVIENLQRKEKIPVTISMKDFMTRPDEAIEEALPLSWKLKRFPPNWENRGITCEDMLQRTRPDSFVGDGSSKEIQTPASAYLDT